LSEHRDIAAAKQFFTKAIERHGAPELKKEGVLPSEMKIWTSKYLNNIIEQDHRRVKQRIYPMLGFKSFSNATVTINGIGLVQKIRKGQFDIANIKKSSGMRVTQLWEAVLVA
jgi:transposase-like protein